MKKWMIIGVIILVILISASLYVTKTNNEDLSSKNCSEIGEIGPSYSLGPNDPNINTTCCEGLIPRSPKNAFEDICESGEGFGTICINCGDGICDTEFESECNCPQDCHPNECPNTQYLSCMPIITPETHPWCYGEYHNWIAQNCNVTFAV